MCRRHGGMHQRVLPTAGAPDPVASGLVAPLGSILRQLSKGGGAAGINIDDITVELDKLTRDYPFQARATPSTACGVCACGAWALCEVQPPFTGTAVAARSCTLLSAMQQPGWLWVCPLQRSACVQQCCCWLVSASSALHLPLPSQSSGSLGL